MRQGFIVFSPLDSKETVDQIDDLESKSSEEEEEKKEVAQETCAKPMCLWLHSNIGSIAISGSLNRWDRWLHATYGTRKLHWLDHVFCCTLFHWLFRCWFIVDLSFWTFFFNCFFCKWTERTVFCWPMPCLKSALSDFVSMLQAKNKGQYEESRRKRNFGFN